MMDCKFSETVFTLPKYKALWGSGTFQIEMTCLIHRESKTPFNYLGGSQRAKSKITPDSEEVMKTIMS